MKRLLLLLGAAIVVPFGPAILIVIGLRKLWQYAFRPKPVLVSEATLKHVQELDRKREHLASMETRGMPSEPAKRMPTPAPAAHRAYQDPVPR